MAGHNSPAAKNETPARRASRPVAAAADARSGDSHPTRRIYDAIGVKPTLLVLSLLIGGLPGWVAMVIGIPPEQGNWAATAGYVSGVAAILGGSFFAASFVLMLRVGWLERLFGGLNTLYYCHHVIGVTAYLVLLLHPLALGLGYILGNDAALALDSTLPSLARPAVLSGWIALLWLMAAMAGTLHVRLSYVGWKWLHASSAFAFAVAIAHVVATVPAIRLSHALLVVWAAAGSGAIAWRLLVDRAKLGSKRYIVSSVRALGADVIEVRLKALDHALDYSAGQFAFVAFYDSQGYRGCAEYHPFTIASTPGDPELRLVVRALGDCTTRMQSLREWVLARVQGPFGSFAPRTEEGGLPQIWIAGGIGITPFLSMAAELAPEGPPIELIYATAKRGDAVCLSDLAQVASRTPRLHVLTLIAGRSEPLTAATIASAIGPLTAKKFFLCGPAEMVQSLSHDLRQTGVLPDLIHAELFDFR